MPTSFARTLAREHGIIVSLRTVERAVASRRQALQAEARATMRFETPPGKQLQIAHFPAIRDLEDFDFAAQPSVDPHQIRELAACRWVAHGEALLLLGPPGVGKTHLAIALGRAAIREGYSVLFVTAPALVAALAKAHAEGRLEERLGFYAKPKLLIVTNSAICRSSPMRRISSFSSSRGATSAAVS
jgi:DNA replication protein DnaC